MKDLTNEVELLSRLRASDLEAFRLVHEKYQPILFRHVLFQTRDRERAHDVVQETFLRVWERHALLDPHRSFLAYLLRISTNLVRDSIRHAKTTQRLQDEIPSSPLSEGDDPALALDRTMLEEELREILNTKLADRCRTVFLLSRFEELSNREIADLLGITVKTVENQMNRAQRILRRRLSRFLK